MFVMNPSKTVRSQLLLGIVSMMRSDIHYQYWKSIRNMHYRSAAYAKKKTTSDV